MAKPREFSDSERAVWRGRAQVWLRQELLPATSSPREQLLLQSLQDADLANVREESLIAEFRHPSESPGSGSGKRYDSHSRTSPATMEVIERKSVNSPDRVP